MSVDVCVVVETKVIPTGAAGPVSQQGPQAFRKERQELPFTRCKIKGNEKNWQAFAVIYYQSTGSLWRLSAT